METFLNIGRRFKATITSRQNRYNLIRKLGTRFAQIRVGRLRLWVDLRDSLGEYFYIHQKYEPFETLLVEQMIKPGMTIVDIGAHIGYYTTLFAMWTGAEGRVIAIEPDPSNMRLLRRNVQLHRFSNVVCEQAAVLDHDGETRLFLSSTNTGDHRIFDAKDDQVFNRGSRRTAVPVRAIALDGYLEKMGIQQVDFVKMDIQGAEMMALPGMIKTLSNPNVALFCEFWPYVLRQAGAAPRQFLESLKQLGLEVFEIVETDRAVVPARFEELSNRFADTDYANLVCVHPQRIADIRFKD
jgi:FkbM family methyltransferase